MKAVKERVHQKTVVSWWRMQYPKLARCLQASSSGAVLAGDERSRGIQMAVLKSCGLVIGQADLFLSIPKHGYHGLYIEMKSLSGKISDDQKEFLEEMRKLGYGAAVCFGADAAILTIRNYMGENLGAVAQTTLSTEN